MHDTPRAVFAHGQESGPWGKKITYLGGIAEQLGYTIESPDFSAIADPGERYRHLQTLDPRGQPLVLIGSSMGGYVAAMACQALQPAALLLMAPALYLDGYPGEPPGCPADTVVVHGWRDTVIDAGTSLAFARARHAALHLLADDHRLGESLDFIGRVFERQLQRALDRRG